ncbi:hypothetical protein AGMMS49546_17190 [Spirochaetia bacterium]|nr:hypothetical protein AGMMS49546_17190 [Spirochaetia bacterium]
MQKKYLIYIGSGLDDLKNERRELPRIIMELGHIPVSADCLDPAEENSAALVNKTIGECDYYISLIAHRYSGPIEAEYTEAINCGLPVLALIIDEKARWKGTKKEKEPEIIRKMDDFKAELRTNPHETWINTADLRQKAQRLLIQAINLDPRQGWVPAAQAISPSLANEIARLSTENEELKKRFRMENNKILDRLREQIKHALKVLALNGASISFHYTPGENWENTRKFRYLRIFRVLAPELSLGKTTVEISRFLGNVLNPDLEKTVRKDYPTPSNTVKKIMADLALLKLVKCTGGDTENAAHIASAGSGDKEIWEITEFGKELYAVYRLRQLERALAKKG